MTLLASFFGLALIAIGLRHAFASFNAQKVNDYKSVGPQLDIRKHFDGKMLCEGVIYGPLGRVSASFVAEMEAHWDGDTGRMTERFTYDSGSVQNREWTFKVVNGTQIEATAPDVIGTGKGAQMGNAVVLHYKIKLPEASGGHVLSATDWMYLCENGTLMNRSQMKKFGITVAELVATMRKA